MNRNVPKLRFKGFEDEWKESLVSSLFDKVRNPVEVDKDTFYKQIGIRSHGKGIFYKDEILGKELGNKRVFWIEPDVFIVNIVFAWERAVARTTVNEIGMIASHRFPMYKPKNEKLNLDYITYFFKTKRGQNLLELASPGGAGRNKTLGQKEFDNLKIKLPSVQEQEKIANFLSKVDSMIEKQEKKVEYWNSYKKGMMQKIFSQKIRFKDENGRDYPEWEEKRLGDYIIQYNEITTENNQYEALTSSRKGLFLQKDYFNKQIASEDNTGYNIVPRGYFTYRHMSDDSIFYFNINNLVDFGIVSTLYPVFTTNENMNSIFLRYYLNEGPEFKKYCLLQKQGGSRTYMYLKKLKEFKGNIPSLNEQIKISEILLNIDRIIEKEYKKLEELRQWKKGLLQQMFV